MKIGILTFHWATNYGAVLQCYALQTYLESLGHQVEVIDYKPRQFDDSLYTFFIHRKFLHIKTYMESRKKETALVYFRNTKLKQTERVYTYKDIPAIISGFDAVISGSDQVLNPSFLLHGERTITPTYFLEFPFKGRKIGYALSFGCVSYPKEELGIASKLIENFNSISVREKTGIDIVASMGRGDAIIVPDPTLLMQPRFYHQLADECSTIKDKLYIYSFFIRYQAERRPIIDAVFSGKEILWNNDDDDYTIQGWLSKIKHAEFVITDSFHCMVMCLKLHKPFAIITNLKGNVGMNDRFYTLLRKVSLESIILHKDDINSLPNCQNITFDWTKIDTVLQDYLSIGNVFLFNSLS